MQITIGKKSHVAAVIFAIVLVILGLVMFVSFAYGAFTFMNTPISNVIVTTVGGSTPSLIVNGSSFAPNASRVVWIDPEFSPDNSQFFDPSSGFMIGTVQSDGAGSISATLNVSQTVLHEIIADGVQIHQVWIFGITSTSGSSPYTDSVSSDAQTNVSTSTRISGIAFFASLYVFDVPLSLNLGQAFIAFWSIYVILFGVALNGPVRNAFSAFKETARRGIKALFDNSLFTVLVIFPVALWGSALLISLQQAAGVPTGSLPPTDPLLEFAGITVAPLREEIGFRVIPIGIVAFVILLSRGRVRDSILALWHPSKYLKKNDSPSQYRAHLHLMYVVVPISAALFGYAHLLGGGWDVGKITQAGAVGVALAVLYYKYGFPSSVLLHWAFDYFTLVEANSPFDAYLAYIILSIAIAIVSTVLLIRLALRKFRNEPVFGNYPLTQ
jgi:hypothetical protein